MLLVEQHVRQALRYADRAYVMRRGRVELSGDSADLQTRITDIEEHYLASGAPATEEDGSLPGTPTSDPT